MKPVGKPDAVIPHVRFDERRRETELWRELRHRLGRKPPANRTASQPTVTAPVVDSTGALAAGPRHRNLRHSPDERGRAPRASAGEDGPARHRIAEASISRLAARRTEPLQHGRNSDDRRGGCQAPESRAREPGRRAHAHCEPDEGHPGPPRHPELQADVVQGAGASRDAAYA